MVKVKLMLWIVLGLMITTVRAELPSRVVLATTDWAPYTAGPSPEMPGIVSEYLTQILAKHQIELIIKSYPWSRAIFLATQTEKVDGLLTAVHQEAPTLSFTATPIMNYKVNFYTQVEEEWRYQTPSSLSLVPAPLGVIQDYGYGEVMEAFIEQDQNQSKLLIMTGELATERLWKMLAKGRVKTLLSDPNVTPKQGKEPLYKEAGTLIDSPFYTALNPQRPWCQELIWLLDEELAAKENQALLKRLIEKYQLR